MLQNPNPLKPFLARFPIPLFFQILISYTAVVFLILLFMAVVTLTNVQLILMGQLKEDLYTSAKNTIHYLELHQQVDGSIFHGTNLAPLVDLEIYDSAGRLLLDNIPMEQSGRPPAPPLNQADITLGDVSTIYGADSVPIYVYYQTWTDSSGHTYYLRFSSASTKEAYFTTTLMHQFSTAIIAGLVFAAIAGALLTYRILNPIRQIQHSLDEVEIDNLNHRVTVPSRRDELHSLASTINETLDRLEAGSRQQQQFVNDASHELRTPVTIIGGYTDMLLRWGKEDPATLEESLTAIQQETLYMQRLIEHLLFLARSAQGRLPVQAEVLNVRELLLSVFESAQPLIAHHQFELENIEAGSEVFIWGDRQLLQQLLRIFIENSIKYTPDGGTIRLSGKQEEKQEGKHEGKQIALSVADTGIGIPAEFHDQIFNRFFRVDSSRAKETGGNGLGLAIARQIVLEHHGTITVDSAPGQGTVMTVHLPLIDPPHENPIDPSA